MSIKFLDGATGTMLWELARQQGIAREAVWKYNIEHPELVEEVAKRYIEAGSDIICSNTFGANEPSVAHSSAYKSFDVAKAGVEIAKRVAGDKALVALDVGPLSELMEPYGDLEEEEAAEIFAQQIGGGMAGGADCIFLETFMDLEMMKVAVGVAKEYDVPVFCSMTFEKSGRTLMGNTVETIVEELEELGVDAIGMNCSLGPDIAMPIIERFRACTKLPIIFKPNAGMPIPQEDGSTKFPMDAEHFAENIKPALEFVSYVGGCCGSTPEHISCIRTAAQGK